MPKSLDEIMEERVSAPESEIPTVEAPEPDKPEPQPEKPEKPAEEPAKPADDGDEPEPDIAAEGDQRVPLKALQESRRLEKEQREINARMQEEMRQMQQFIMQIQAPQPQQPKEAEKPPVYWEDPEGFVNHALTPVQQAMERQRVQTSKLIASSQVSAEELDAMDIELAQAAQIDPAAAAEAQRIAKSEHPYGELVKWHRQRKLLTEVGSDPAAYEAKIREKVMAELAAQQPAPVTPTQPAAQQPQMPSSFAAARNQGGRSTPAYGGPQPLSAITKGSAQ